MNVTLAPRKVTATDVTETIDWIEAPGRTIVVSGGYLKDVLAVRILFDGRVQLVVAESCGRSAYFPGTTPIHALVEEGK